MKKSLVKSILIINLLVILALYVMPSIAYAQNEEKIPADFFMGKWQGSVQYDVKFFDNKGRITSHHTSSLKNINIVAEEYDEEDAPSVETLKSLGMDNRTAEWMSKMRNSFNGNAVYTSLSQFYDNRGMLSGTWELKNGTENIEISGTFFSNNRIWIGAEGTVEIKRGPFFEEHPTFSFGAAAFALTVLEGIDFKIKDNTLFINYERNIEIGSKGNEYIKITGELYRVKECTTKDKIPLDMLLSTEYKGETKTFPNGTEVQKIYDKIKIVTKDGCVELYIKEYFKITGSDGTEMEISVSKVLDGIVESNLYQGYIQVDIRGNGKHHTFATKDAIVEVSGTNFTLRASKDGITILTVLDGEVKFSDKQKKKTVVVKKNQISVVNLGGLPSEPVSIDPKHIPRWWE